MTDPVMVTETEDLYIWTDVESSVESLIEALQNIRKVRGSSARIWKDYQGFYDGAYDLMLSYDRPENPEEKEYRLNCERAAKIVARKKREKLELEEKAEYIRLKAKFGPKFEGD